MSAISISEASDTIINLLRAFMYTFENHQKLVVEFNLRVNFLGEDFYQKVKEECQMYVDEVSVVAN